MHLLASVSHRASILILALVQGFEKGDKISFFVFKFIVNACVYLCHDAYTRVISDAILADSALATCLPK
jgi:hypothetical protein